MSSFSQYKITAEAIAQKGVIAAPDTLTGTAAENKAVFDRLVRESVAVRFNALVDALESSTGALESDVDALEGSVGTLRSDVDTLRSDVDSIGKSRNLLINSYFIGGGSQQGGGQFPINQRGQTSYTGAWRYGIDRWKVLAGTGIYLQQNSLKVLADSIFCQRIEEGVYNAIVNKTCTVSMLDSSGNLTTKTDVFNPNGYSQNGAIRFGGKSAGWNLNFPYVIIYDPSNDIEVVAIKLELGDMQTLARNIGTEADPQWVLNDPQPNFQQELAKCQRYYRVYATEAQRPSKALDCSPPMRIDPAQGTIVIGGTTCYYNDAEL